MRLEVVHFVLKSMAKHPVHPGAVLDVGALDINGTVHPIFQKLGWSYTGFDQDPGKNVDLTGDLYELDRYFNRHQFDCVVSLETLEHVTDPVMAVESMKYVLKPGGLMILSAAGNGFPEHRHPIDCWRILPDGMRHLLRGFDRIEIEETEPGTSPGIMGSGYKPITF